MAFEVNVDEYTYEAKAIVAGLPTTSGAIDVRALVHAVFVEWFDASSADPLTRYSDVAHDIWEVWRRHHHPTAPV
ncbi:hypothetical protein [Phycicoccus avicenniae]|uniref:hypothetical protein n=1 Tax=Phycicoccus avicenniae TaxID=2828860 RepID=UPI003D2ACA94